MRVTLVPVTACTSAAVRMLHCSELAATSLGVSRAPPGASDLEVHAAIQTIPLKVKRHGILIASSLLCSPPSAPPEVDSAQRKVGPPVMLALETPVKAAANAAADNAS
jgi:hypothetical protein